MPFRKTHRKSRRGCFECKRRRVKCNEQQPQCSNCVQRGIQCAYPALPIQAWPSGEAPSTSPGPASRTSTPLSVAAAAAVDEDPSLSPLERQWHQGSSASVSSSATTPATSLNLIQLELMSHWCLTAYKTLARDEETGNVWRALVSQEALQAPFLMHGILGLSALHLARASDTPPSRRTMLLNLSEAHQDQSLTDFRSQLSCISSENAKAMFAFSAIIVAYAFGHAVAVEDQDADSKSYLGKLLQLIMLSRGIQHVIGTTPREDLIGSNFQPLFSFQKTPSALPPHVQASLEQLRSLITDALISDSSSQQVYHKATHSLQELAMVSLGPGLEGRGTLTLASGWAMCLPQQMLNDLKEYQPLALVVLAHYCVFLHLQREHWCLGNWGALVLRDIWRILDDKWKAHVRWCIMEVQLTDILSQS